ncbi:MAG: hypothetical protein QXI64_10000 [Sulfolobales archaeon]
MFERIRYYYYQDEEEIYSYEPPRASSPYWGSPLTHGILETSNSTLSGFEKRIRDAYNRLITICRANNIPVFLCESAFQVYRKIMYICREVVEARGNGNGDRGVSSSIYIHRVLRIPQLVLDTNALATVLLLIRLRRILNLYGDPLKEEQLFLALVSHRDDLKEIVNQATKMQKRLEHHIKELLKKYQEIKEKDTENTKPQQQ